MRAASYRSCGNPRKKPFEYSEMIVICDSRIVLNFARKMRRFGQTIADQAGRTAAMLASGSLAQDTTLCFQQPQLAEPAQIVHAQWFRGVCVGCLIGRIEASPQ
jgi:hypothetical protein